MGMQPGPEKDKLFEQDLEGLTLAKVVELAESERSVRQGAAAGAGARACNERVKDRNGQIRA